MASGAAGWRGQDPKECGHPWHIVSRVPQQGGGISAAGEEAAAIKGALPGVWGAGGWVFWSWRAKALTCGPGKPSRPGRPSMPGMPASPCSGSGEGQDAAPDWGAQGSCPLPCTPKCWDKAIPTSQGSYLWSWQARLSRAAKLSLQGKRCQRHPYRLPAGILHGWRQVGRVPHLHPWQSRHTLQATRGS